jgi:hypothetical protein
MLAYALGRELDYYDESQITNIKTRADQSGARFSDLVLGVVTSHPFQSRRESGPTVKSE